MTISVNNLKRLAGITERRNVEGDAMLLADQLLRSLRRYRQLSERDISESLIITGASLKRQVTEATMGSDIYRMKELAGLFEEEENDSDSGSNSGSNSNYETDRNGNETGTSPAVKTELAALHSELMDCWSSLRKCIMDCTIDGSEVPSTLRSTIDKLGRAIEEMEELAGKV